MRIYSGFYHYPTTHFPVDWVVVAIKKLMDWSRSQNAEFICNSYSLSAWGKFANWPQSFQFGTLIKIAIMRDYLDDSKSGDRFLWLDLDIYPTARAYAWDLASLPQDSLWGSYEKPTWCNYPTGPTVSNTEHAFGKLAWANADKDKRYYHTGAGIYSLSRSNAERYLAFIEDGLRLDSQAWWKRYYERQMQVAASIKDAMPHADGWMFGTDEHYFEEWVNTSGVKFFNIPNEIHDVHWRTPHAYLLHYAGQDKRNYPDI